MLTSDENQLLTQTNAGTPMGDLYRRFWLPVMLAEEVPIADGIPVRVSVLGERLVAFKDTEGRVGLLDARCSHRSANLFWGRNEQSGLRCAYHGWKYDVKGTCVDIPNAPEGAAFKEKISAFAAYPTQEQGGFIWAYMGPRDSQPPFPEFEINRVPASHRHITKVLLRANWMQLMEGELDSSHVSFLHSRIDTSENPLAARDRMQGSMFSDAMPTWLFKETDYGMMLGARRNGAKDKSYWRVNQWLMPSFTMIAALPGTPVHLQIRLPIDDQSSLFYRAIWHPTRPLTDKERWDAEHGAVNFPEMIPGTYLPKENMENDYLIDRASQKTISFSGIKSIPAQDWAVQEDMGGPVADRSIEHLVSSDAAIISVRKRLITTARDLQEGTEPKEPQSGSMYRVRPIDIMLDREEEVWDGARDYLEAKAW
jgi:phthalate 4,5-dioxygenase oxygenase subunit